MIVRRVRKDYVPEGYVPSGYFAEDYFGGVEPSEVAPPVVVVVPPSVVPEVPAVSTGLAAIMIPSMDSRWWRWLYERRRKKKTSEEMYNEIWNEEDELAFLGVL